VWGTILTKSLGLDMALVHYRGAAPAQQDLIAGRLQFLFDNVSAAKGLVQDGRVQGARSILTCAHEIDAGRADNQ
jgi:tripartite-type tricarboxylate transporter receptor subunit TctC